MSTRTRIATLAAIAIALWQLPAYGVPKAAENKNAPVVIVPDVPRPTPAKPSAKPSKKKAATTVRQKLHKPASAVKKTKSRTKK